MGKEQSVLDQVLATASKNDPDAIIAAVDQYCSDGIRMTNSGAEKSLIVDRAIDNISAQKVLELGASLGIPRLGWRAGLAQMARSLP